MQTVTVACKLPNGLLLRAFKMREVQEAVMGGSSRTTKQAEQIGEPVKINGYNTDFITGTPARKSPGFALTFGVPKDVWDAWLEDNKDSAIVKNGLIFAHAKKGHAQGFAKEHAEQRNGMEPLNVGKGSKDPRLLRSVKPYDKKDANSTAA